MCIRDSTWPDPRVKPPYGAAEIDWGHPLSRALIVHLLFNEGGGLPRDMGLMQSPWVFTGSPAWQARTNGLGLVFDNTNKHVDSSLSFVLASESSFEARAQPDLVNGAFPVSYTHLTLPTSDL